MANDLARSLLSFALTLVWGTAAWSDDSTAICIRDLETSESQLVMDVGAHPTDVVWSPTGDSLYFSARRASHDIFRWTLADNRVSNITDTDSIYEFSPSLPPTGDRLVYIAREQEDRTFRYRLLLLSTSSANAPGVALLPPGPILSGPVFSPDGEFIAFSMRDSESPDDLTELYILPVQGDAPIRVTPLDGIEDHHLYPVWSPDGSELAFTTQSRVERVRYSYIERIRVDGTRYERLTALDESSERPTWSPDGKTIAFASKRTDNWDLFLLDLDSKRVRNLTDSLDIHENHPAWSPDGKKLAYTCLFSEDTSRTISPKYTLLVHLDGSLSLVPYTVDIGPYGQEKIGVNGDKVIIPIDETTVKSLVSRQ